MNANMYKTINRQYQTCFDCSQFLMSHSRADPLHGSTVGNQIQTCSSNQPTARDQLTPLLFKTNFLLDLPKIILKLLIVFL